MSASFLVLLQPETTGTALRPAPCLLYPLSILPLSGDGRSTVEPESKLPRGVGGMVNNPGSCVGLLSFLPVSLKIVADCKDFVVVLVVVLVLESAACFCSQL